MKTAKNNIAMKAILIIIAVFGIQISTFVASNVGDVVTTTKTSTFFCPICPFLIPVIPMVAPFVEIIEMESLMNLNPVIPIEATFENDVELAANSFTPIVPMQADFDDGVILSINDDDALVPVVPLTADFNDKL